MLKKLFGILIAFLILPLITTGVYAAKNLQRSETVLVPKGEVVEGDYFAAGERVTIAGTVNGDAYVAGGNVVVEGEINGDLITAGGTVNVRGKVAQDVRAGGGQVTVLGDVGGNVTLVGGSLEIADSAKITGSLVSAGGNLAVFAPIGKGATFGAGNATIGNLINGDVTAGVGELALTPNAKVAGDLNYWSERGANIQQGAEVSGKTTHNFPPKKEKQESRKALGGVLGFFKIVSFLAALVIGVILIKLAPQFTKITADTIVKKPVASLGIGLLTLIITPIVILIAAITVIGIPIALILLVLFLITMYFAKIFVSVAIGRKIVEVINQKAGDYAVFILGLLVYTILTLIPVIGVIVGILALLCGVGAIVATKKSIYKQLRTKKLI